MAEFKTEQEQFWHGAFGDEYITRNQDAKLIASNIALFSRAFSHVYNMETLIEFGANAGMNMAAIHQLWSQLKLSAIEINQKASDILRQKGYIDVFNESILDFNVKEKYDMVLIKGVLIHINPDELQDVYEKLYDASARYICIAEYYNPTPVELSYRGHEGKLFKRDFAGEMLDKFTDLKLLDYGFTYHRDNNFMHADANWFILEKR